MTTMTKDAAVGMMIRAVGAVGVAAVVGAFAISCVVESTYLREDHCANQNGDAWCEERYGEGARPYCVRGVCGPTFEHAGCVEEQPEDEACYSPCGGRMSASEDVSCLEGEESGSESGSSGETGTTGMSEESSSGTTTGEEPCLGDGDCMDASAPFCEPASGACVACDETKDGDGACAGVDAGLPLCVDGDCVACTPENPVVCDGQLLLCDGETNACVGCVAHEECASGACELAEGTCFEGTGAVHVDGDGGQDFMSIVEAVASVDDGLFGVIVVHERDGGLSYQEPVVIDGGKTIALLAAAGESPIVQGTGGAAGVRVEGAGTVLYMEGLELSLAAAAQGLIVNEALVWAERSRIVQNTGGGVLAENGAELVLRNCFVGQAVSEVVGVEVDDASATILYSTITATTFGTTPALGCSSPMAVDIRNSIVVTQGGTSPDELSCATATVTNTSTEADLPMFDVGWFEDFNGGDYGLTKSGAPLFENIAQWQSGDPPTDIDGDPRPTVDATPDYAGADVP